MFIPPSDLIVSLPATTYEYYVDFDAEVDGNGSSDFPWNSFASAQAELPSSRPLYLYLKGTSEQLGEYSWGKSGLGVGNELVITAWDTNNATINGYFRVNSSHVIIDGKSFTLPQLTFCGAGQGRTFRTGWQGSSYSNVTVWRTELTGGPGVHVFTQETKIYNCLLHDITSHAIYHSSGADCEIRNNLIYNIPVSASGIQINPHDTGNLVEDGIVSGNAIYDCGRGFTILSGAGSNGEISNVDIYNNIVWNTDSESVKFTGGIDYSGTITGVKVYNNTFLGNVYNAHGDDVSRPATTLFRNNITSGIVTHATDCEFIAESNNLIGSTAMLISIDPTSVDFAKRANSDDGYITGISLDYFGLNRSTSPDIGASEYIVGVLPTIAITSPTTNAEYRTSASLITIAGIAFAGTEPINSVTWVNVYSEGSSNGLATGTTSWEIVDIGLFYGYNAITVTVTDAESNTATDLITVARSKQVLTMNNTEQTQSLDIIILLPFGWLSMNNSFQLSVSEAIILTGIPQSLIIPENTSMQEIDSIVLSLTDNVFLGLEMQNSIQAQVTSTTLAVIAKGKMKVIVTLLT